MKTVWILQGKYDYQLSYTGIVGVFANRESADQEMDKWIEERRDMDFILTEYEVKE